MSIATVSSYGKYVDLQRYTGSEPANSGSIYLSGSAGSELVYFNRGLNSAGSVEAESSFVIGSADLDETDLEKLDGITNGTVAANKAVVVDASKDATGFRHITAAGAVTAGTSFIIGSADLNETDLEKLDGITNGTVAASKAVVVDASKDASGFRNLDMTGDLTAGTVTMTGFAVDADGDTALKSLKVDDGSTIGCDSDSDLMTLADGALTVAGTLSCDTSFTLDATTLDATELGYLDGVTAGTAAASKALVLDSNKALGTITHLTATYAQIDTLDVNTINSVTQTVSDLEVSDRRIVAALSASAANADGGGLRVGGGADSSGHMAMLWDNANSAMDFNIGGTTEMRLQDGVLRPETDNDVDLGASGAEFKDLYLDGVAYIEDLRADALGAALNCASQAMTNINVDSGVIDGTVIGGNSAAAGTFAALVATTFSGSGAAQFASSVTAAGALNVSGAINADGALDVAGAVDLAASGVETNVRGTLGVTEAATFDAGVQIDGAATLNGDVDLGNATSDTITATGRFDSDLVPSTDSARALGSSALQWSAAHVDVGHIDQLGSAMDCNSQAMTNINVDGGAIDGTVIGANSAAAGTFAALVGTSLSVSDGDITNVGAISLDSIQADGSQMDISLTDNQNGALEIKEGSNTYMSFNTDDGDEHIVVSKMLELGGDGAGVDFKLFGGSANHFMLYDASENRLEFTQDGSSNHITIGGDASGEYAVDVADGSSAKNKIRAAAFVTYSDERLKTDVAPIQGALSTVNSLNAVNFTWKKDGSRDFGFMAQELARAIPQAVHGNEEGLYGVDYGRLTSVLVAAIQEQSAQIDALKAKLDK